MDEQEATVAGPEAPTKKRRGRPPGPTKRGKSDRELIQEMAKRMDALQSELDETKEAAANQQAGLKPIDIAEIKLPPEAEEIPPGTMIQVGKDQVTGMPIWRKKPWRRDDFKRLYEQVTFHAQWSVPVTINGVLFQIEGGKENTVPSVVKDEYLRRMRLQHNDYANLLPAPSPNAVFEINELARKSPGQRVFSGLHWLGVGLNVHTPEPAEEPEGQQA